MSKKIISMNVNGKKIEEAVEPFSQRENAFDRRSYRL